ncbi:MAG: ABC transporter permease, partial [Ilumatobacteraceae bacterium]
YRGWLDAVVSFFADSLLAFPPLILLLGLMAVLEPSVRNVTLGLAVLGIPIYVRLARANTMALAERDFVVAARVLGAKDRRLLLREILPNVAPMVLSYAFVVVAVMIVAEASLSYLGLSVQRPEPTWGNMISAGQDSFDRHPHLVFVPGLVLFVSVLALNHVGEAVRSAWTSGARSSGE